MIKKTPAGNKQDSERSARPSDESVLNYTHRIQGYALSDRFMVFEDIEWNKVL